MNTTMNSPARMAAVAGTQPEDQQDAEHDLEHGQAVSHGVRQALRKDLVGLHGATAWSGSVIFNPPAVIMTAPSAAAPACVSHGCAGRPETGAHAVEASRTTSERRSLTAVPGSQITPAMWSGPKPRTWAP